MTTSIVSDVKSKSAHTSTTGNGNSIKLQFTNVTGSRSYALDVPRDTPVQQVIDAVASGMQIPSDVSVSLRRDDSSYLPATGSIGAVVDEEEPELTVVPNATLGGRKG